MTTDQVAVDKAGLKKSTKKGLVGAFWLAVLTVAEFIVYTVGHDASWRTIALLPFVFAKGWIILDTFMHLRALWSEDH